ncbi:MAG TPA: hypothetical protein DDW36_03100 [Candidatus Magasanikbacteria bacterium]|nr:hypothetical protein [Candidatus Magasanikbacteria bacterium]
MQTITIQDAARVLGNIIGKGEHRAFVWNLNSAAKRSAKGGLASLFEERKRRVRGESDAAHSNSTKREPFSFAYYISNAGSSVSRGYGLHNKNMYANLQTM